MLSTSKLKCPSCGRHVMKRVLVLTEGKCNNCGYHMTGSISNFFKKAGLSSENGPSASLAKV